MTLDQNYWANRYQQGNIGWDLGKISPPLKSYIDQLKDLSLKILVPGAGNSYEAEYLYSKGFKNVHVVDIAEEPLQNLKHRAPSFPEENLICQDFFELKEQYDLILEQTFFCALPLEKRRDYVIKSSQLLKPGGKLAGVLFGIDFPMEGPPFGGSKEEFVPLFEPYFNIEVLENCYNSIPPRQGSELFFIFKKITCTYASK